MKYLLSHDIGTSGNKASLFAKDGVLINSVVEPYRVAYLPESRVEQNPDCWYRAVCKTTRMLLDNIDSRDILAMSFSGQMMGCLCIDRQGTPLMDSIIWADTRANYEERFIKSKIDQSDFYRKTGHRISSSYTLSKILWLKNNKPDIYHKTYKILNAKDYVIYKLTGGIYTDLSDASGTNLLNINTLQWEYDFADILDLDADKMPVLRKSTDIVGEITPEASLMTGLRVSTPIVIGGGDGVIAAVGACSVAEGEMFTTLGTSAWNAVTSKKAIFDSEMKLFNWVHAVPDMYLPCGTMQSAGASVDWIKEILYYGDQKAIDIHKDMEHCLQKSPIGANGVMFLPYLLGERCPRWNTNARGAFVNLMINSSRSDIIRSVYEGITLNLNLIFDIFILNYNKKIESIILTGGGAKSNAWCQMIADAYNVEVKIPSNIENSTSIGAAITAGVGIGIYNDFKVTPQFIQTLKTFRPITKNNKKYSFLKDQFDRIYYALKTLEIKN